MGENSTDIEPDWRGQQMPLANRNANSTRCWISPLAGSMDIRNFCILLQHYMASPPRRPWLERLYYIIVSCLSVFKDYFTKLVAQNSLHVTGEL